MVVTDAWVVHVMRTLSLEHPLGCLVNAHAGAIAIVSSDMAVHGSTFFINNSAGAGGGENGYEPCIV